MLLGAATPDLDVDVRMQKNKKVWCFGTRSRWMFLAGTKVGPNGRKGGPSEFPVEEDNSCSIVISVDSAVGTLSVKIVGGDDLGVVIDSLPKNEKLHLAVGTGKPECKVTLLPPNSDAQLRENFDSFDEESSGSLPEQA
jgi:hypothetical protein